MFYHLPFFNNEYFQYLFGLFQFFHYGNESLSRLSNSNIDSLLYAFASFDPFVVIVFIIILFFMASDGKKTHNNKVSIKKDNLQDDNNILVKDEHGKAPTQAIEKVLLAK